MALKMKYLDWKHHATLTKGESTYHVWRLDYPKGSVFQVTNSIEIKPPLGCGHYTHIDGVLSRFVNPQLVLDEPENT